MKCGDYRLNHEQLMWKETNQLNKVLRCKLSLDKNSDLRVQNEMYWYWNNVTHYLVQTPQVMDQLTPNYGRI